MPGGTGAVIAGKAIGWSVAVHHGASVWVRDNAEHWE